MESTPKGTRSVFARTISAYLRARIGADKRLTGQKLAQGIGRSQNYVAERLRDEKPFTLDDVGLIADFFFVDAAQIILDAAEYKPIVEEEIQRLDDEWDDYMAQLYRSSSESFDLNGGAEWLAAKSETYRRTLESERGGDRGDFELAARNEDREKRSLSDD